MKESSNTHKIESSKRKFLQSAASVGLGSVAFAQGSLARDTTHDFVRTVKSSQQYQKISEVLTNAGFQPQFDQAVVFQLDQSETTTGVSGRGMIVPTRNHGTRNASVELKAFQSSNTDGLKVSAVVKKHGLYAGHVYTDSRVVKTKAGYTTSHSPSGQGPMPFGDWIPDNPIDKIIDKGTDIVNGATDAWEETAEFVKNNDKIESAYSLGEDAYDISADLFSPVENDRPPEGLNQWMEKRNFYWVKTLDMTKTCWYIDIAASLTASGFTVTTFGVGAVTFTVPAAITAACGVITAVDVFLSDTDRMCNPTNLYIFAPENPTDGRGHPVPPLFVPHCK